MLKLYSFIGATAGSYAGWALGAPVGITTAFIISMVGTGLGIYVGRRVAHHYGA
jgi:phage tail tape-measure protein